MTRHCPWTLTSDSYGKTILRMTTTLSVKGQVVIPQPLRATHKLRPGTDFTILTRSNGDIILRPVKGRRHHATLADNLLALSGLPLNAERAASRDVEF